MLSEEEIRKALHASRVVPISIPNPHGPLGLEHVALLVAELQAGNRKQENKVVRPLEVPLETWLKLEQLAEAATKSAARPVSVSEVAVAILKNYVANQ
jgi:hypothetical protein